MVIEKSRADIEVEVQNLVTLKGQLLGADPFFSVLETEDRGETIANVTLALRHLEDARMRLGKVYQSRNGGVSNSTR